MATTIGERLRQARKEQGLSIEDVAHATRIHSNTLQGLEDDDYSSFASTTYAKSFLTLYARHLDVDADDALEQFSKGNNNTPIVSGANYIRSVAEAIEPVEHAGGATTSLLRGGSNYAEATPQRRSSGGGGGGRAHPIFLGMFLLILLALIPTLYIAGKDADSPQDALNNLGRMAGVEPASTGGDASGKPGADPTVTPPAIGTESSPGTRVTPAAPMTRNTSEARNPTIIEEPSPPIAQASTPAPIAQPIPVGPPIKARPIVAKPVVLPVEENDGDGDDNGNESPDDPESGDADGPESPDSDDTASDEDATDPGDDPNTEATAGDGDTTSDAGG